MDLGLAGKTVVVVGGSSNLGRHTCLGFAREGANVVVCARGLPDCQRVADLCNLQGSGHSIGVSADATKLEECKRLAEKTMEVFTRIDVLVISIGWNRLAYFLDLEPEDWDQIISTNYIATLCLFKTVLPIMVAQKGGSIVTMSSVIGRKGDPHEPVYGGCKAAQINLTHSVAMEMARHGIRLNVVAPALTMPDGPETLGGNSVWKGAFTPEDQKVLIEQFESATPLGTIAKPDDVANAVLFFASDVMSGHVTGNVIGTDGGMFMGH
jgi:2-hydroxycyclohexanecarboxyl-CoA dehydrogenase